MASLQRPPAGRAAPPRHVVIAWIAGFALLTGLGWFAALNRAFEAFDAGVFSNVLWKVAHGAGDLSALTGAHHFADHPSGTVLLTVPFYRIGVTPGVLAFVTFQAASVVLVAVAVWQLARHWDLPARSQWGLMAAVVLGPGALYAATADLHALSLGLGPLAMTASTAIRGDQSRWAWVWPVLAAAARTELAFVVLLMGLLVLRREAPSRAPRVIAIGAVFSIGYVAWIVLSPLEGSSTQVHFAHLGDTPLSVITGALRRPWAVLGPLFTVTPWLSIVVWLGFFGFVAPLAGWRWLAAGAPSLLIPVLGSWPAADQWITQYWYVLIPIGGIAAAAGLAAKPDLNRLFPLIVGAVVGIVWIVGLATAFGGLYSSDYSEDAVLDVVLDELVEGTDSVAAPSQLVVPLAGRDEVMVMPRPFLCASANYGSFRPPEAPPRLVIVDRRWDFAELPQIVEVLEAGYARHAESETVVVWRLTEPGVDFRLETCD